MAISVWQCVCVGPRHGEVCNDEWTVWEGWFDSRGRVSVIAPILHMDLEAEIIRLGKLIGAKLRLPVYQILPGREPEMIQPSKRARERTPAEPRKR